MTAKSGNGIKIRKSARGDCPFLCFFFTLYLFFDTSGYFIIKVSCCLVSRTLSIACHGYRTSWSFHHCFPCIYFSLLQIAFPEYLCFFNSSSFVFSLTSVKVLNKPSHWGFLVCLFYLLYFSVLILGTYKLAWEGRVQSLD